MGEIPGLASGERYPTSLPFEICNPFAYDLPSLDEKLDNETSRLFVENDGLRIRVIESCAGGISEYHLKSLASLECYLSETVNFQGTRICLISQLSSRGPLTVSSEGMRKLLGALLVFPEFLTILHQFGSRTGNQCQGYGSFHSISRSHTAEFSYLLKYVEQHGRANEQNPWSIRQVGVYQSSSQTKSTFIVLNPPKSLRPRLKAILATPGTKLPASGFRLLLFSMVSRNWPKYVDWLDEGFQDLKRKAHSASMTRPFLPTKDLQYTQDIKISDAQDIEIHRSRICETQACLTSNSNIFQETKAYESKELSQPIEHVQSQGEQHLTQYIRSNKDQNQRLHTILEMLDSTSALIRNILDLRSLEAVEVNSRTTMEISRRAEAGNDLMLNIARKSYRDARTLKVITIVTLVYLPASFIAQLLSTGYLSVSTNQQSGNVELHFKAELIIFAVLTVVFLSVTIGIWLWLDRSYKSIDNKSIDNKSNDFFIKSL